MDIKSEDLKKKFEQLALGLCTLSKGHALNCTLLDVDGYSISCMFSFRAARTTLTRTLKLHYPIDPYTVTEENVFERLASTVLIAFGVIPLDHSVIKSKIHDILVAGQQMELLD